MDFITFSTKFWKDPYVRTLCPTDKLLYAYLFSNSEVEYGFLEYDPEMWTLWLSMDAHDIELAIRKFINDGKLHREGSTIYVRNALKHLRLSGNNLTGALRKVKANWSDKAPQSVAECLARYGGSEPGPTGFDPVPAEGGTNVGTAPVSYQPNPVQQTSKERETIKQPKETTRKVTTSRRSQAEERAKIRADKEAKDLEVLRTLEEECLPQQARATWKDLKDGMAAENESGVQAPSVPLRLLKEILSVIESDKLKPDAVVHGLEACLHPASGGVAGNKTYFRKAANGYKPPRTGPIFEGSRGPGSGSPMGRSISTDYKDTELVDEPA